ncbi:hypothetical protein LWP59_18085 [Amycolatopsis acidiphila]|uniref:Uncharacterized protein n=1 Tax=Amycolatopsis acidiphila TaxID=715473 RepID=A0A558ANQ0_9PSEU|nr:hypothetical protein [Amycolatopsis acidiphila]TVT25892.1 hypothetical protein FNH06_00150 [Amycolatopsis acidiphila]UIJ63409.1 hypothetical protein LWP59_18085 [Amycolatopsis acidiphila]GHG75448.1 hypothetical protein GCM10017788_40390 [Amycolatopsis acidiphila]
MAERTYEFRVSGELSERICDIVGDFSEMRIITAPPETLIYSRVPDVMHLHGILRLCEDLGLRIVSVQQVPEPQRAPQVPKTS